MERSADVHHLTRLSDGSLLVSGLIDAVGSTQAYGLAKLKADGSLDAGFQAQSAYWSYSNLVSVEQTDKKLLLGGPIVASAANQNIGITRLNEDGSPDNSFTSPVANGNVNTIHVQPDGKILIGGTFALKTNPDLKNIARLKTDGSLDETFLLTAGAEGNVKVIKAQPDGKLIVAGDFTWFENSSGNRKMVRLQANGAVDYSFSWQNQVHDLNGIVDVLPTPDNKIYFATKAKVNSTDTGFVGIGCLTQDGSSVIFNNPMTQGGTNGVTGTVTTLALQEGKVLAGGFFLRRAMPSLVFRFTQDGTYDDTFVRVQSNDTAPVRSLVVQPDNSILIGGSVSEVQKTFSSGLSKLNPNGTIETSFAPDLRAEAHIRKVLVQADSKVIIAGDLAYVNGTYTGSAARLLPDGSLDETFALGNYMRGISPVVAIQGNYIIVPDHQAGTLTRLDYGGMIDPAFNKINISSVTALATAPDGKILVAGNINNKLIARLNADGSLDTSFDLSPGINYQARSLAVQADGKILVGKWSMATPTTPADYMVRLNSNSTHDASFSIGSGPAHATGPYIFTMLPETNGSMTVVGQFTSFDGNNTNGSIIRLREDGTYLEPLFIPDAQLGSAYDLVKGNDNSYFAAIHRVNGTYKGLIKILSGPLASPDEKTAVLQGSAFPNPFTNQIRFSLKESLKADVQVRVLSLQGQELYSEKRVQRSNAGHYDVPVAYLGAGTYLLEVTANGRVNTQRIVKLNQ
ncbi:T9SS type A sorting domain-containing protein [Rufibacter sediminis]|uniref:T9SS type A sorting domain-containing protein n=1 Tax=Rufibacter sediminis TaxID=2762756 RepID=A0ABR6VU45_9BACT|nr:T9SS type A sorting domain-containing protein [Rufibacter sediminis]MBC3540732.1 T9SS type A sorting domain-containing protein [Rufibacter sediminis]